jgi:predicted DNA-binding transcriptional regulator AlpA
MNTINSGVTSKAALSIDEFCSQHGISRATFYNLKKAGKAPLEMHVGTRRLISVEAAATWRRQMEAQAA